MSPEFLIFVLGWLIALVVIIPTLIVIGLIVCCINCCRRQTSPVVVYAQYPPLVATPPNPMQ
jgi:hypothetical protein